MSRSERLPSPHFAISSATTSLHNSWVLRRALATQEQELGPNHPNTATSLNNLALLYHTQGKYTQAEPLYQRALAICEHELGPNHPDTATSLNNLAALYRNQGKYTQAEPLC